LTYEKGRVDAGARLKKKSKQSKEIKRAAAGG
jgi:hypothetical protein